MRAFLTAAALTAALAVPAVAQAAPLTILKVRACHLGDASRDRQATFFGQMHAVPGTSRMSMRFTLYRRTGVRALQPVPSGDLQQWRRSRSAVRTFGYAQTVTGLQPGGVYLMGVEYRWLDASGNVLRTRRRTSTACRQDGPLPNLTITGLSARAGQSSGTEVYAIEVANEGAAPAHQASVDVFVDSAQADTARIDTIAPGETATLHITGPTCAQRIRAVVDRLDAIAETTDDDNTLRSGCPPIQP